MIYSTFKNNKVKEISKSASNTIIHIKDINSYQYGIIGVAQTVETCFLPVWTIDRAALSHLVKQTAVIVQIGQSNVSLLKKMCCYFETVGTR